ncbi:hypothetical protein GIW63_23705, partial [Pseudomonas syringae]|nr:hypothetical protein [Pseudomonas syringae]
MFAKGPVQSQKIRRLKQCLREQVRSYKSHPAPMPKRRSELVRERARTVAKDSSFETMFSRTNSLLQKPVLMPERRSELVRERAST